MDTPGGAEPSAARDQLWERLLAGQLTRVAVSCDIEPTEIFRHFIPHSLGLERIWPQAHQQDRTTGAWRTGAQLERIARDLAAGDGWICGSGRPGWDAYFMRDAEAVLVFRTAARRRRMRLATIQASVSMVLRIVLRRKSGYDDGGMGFAVHGPRPRRALYSRTSYYALENHAEKTFVIDQRRYLTKLRAI